MLFALAVILPGFVLSTLGFVTLSQDQRLADQQVRERRDLLADRAVATLEMALREWTTALSSSSSTTNPDPAGLVPLLRAAIERSDSAAYVSVNSGGANTWPAQRLLYSVGDSSPGPLAPGRLAPALVAAERLELEQRDLTRAAAAYGEALAAADPSVRGDVLFRLARTYRKSGREDLAASIRLVSIDDRSYLGDDKRGRRF